MGLISRVSSRTYRLVKKYLTLQITKMNTKPPLNTNQNNSNFHRLINDLNSSFKTNVSLLEENSVEVIKKLENKSIPVDKKFNLMMKLIKNNPDLEEMVCEKLNKSCEFGNGQEEENDVIDGDFLGRLLKEKSSGSIKRTLDTPEKDKKKRPENDSSHSTNSNNSLVLNLKSHEIINQMNQVKKPKFNLTQIDLLKQQTNPKKLQIDLDKI